MLEDVKGGFQNVKWEVRSKGPNQGNGGWLKTFFKKREFTIEWDRKVRGNGKMNVGAPQSSPLWLVIFLIYIAPILEEIERRLTGDKIYEQGRG